MHVCSILRGWYDDDDDVLYTCIRTFQNVFDNNITPRAYDIIYCTAILFRTVFFLPKNHRHHREKTVLLLLLLLYAVRLYHERHIIIITIIYIYMYIIHSVEPSRYRFHWTGRMCVWVSTATRSSDDSYHSL